MTAALIVLAVLAAVQLPLEAWAGRERRRLRAALAEHAPARREHFLGRCGRGRAAGRAAVGASDAWPRRTLMATRGVTFTVTDPTTLVTETCFACGVLFAMTEEFRAQRLKERERGSFYCPNGHAQHYLGKSDAEKAREAEQHVEELRLRLAAERDQRIATERELKRHQKRATAGACPCCNRTFVQLARHMKTKHPDFAPAGA